MNRKRWENTAHKISSTPACVLHRASNHPKNRCKLLSHALCLMGEALHFAASVGSMYVFAGIRLENGQVSTRGQGRTRRAVEEPQEAIKTCLLVTRFIRVRALPAYCCCTRNSKLAAEIFRLSSSSPFACHQLLALPATLHVVAGCLCLHPLVDRQQSLASVCRRSIDHGVCCDSDPDALRGGVVGGRGGGGAELQRHLQLRRLDHGHGQPVHQRQAVADHLHAAPLRRDLLRHADVPLLRRPRRRRLPQHSVRAAVPAAVQVEQRRLQAGRQHGHHGRNGHGRPLLPLARPLRQDLEQRAHQLSAPVVPADRHRRLRTKYIYILHDHPLLLYTTISITTRSIDAIRWAGCKSYLANSLFVFGEFGGNDYNAMIFGGYTIEQARKYTPKIVNTISRGIDKLIGLGATDIVVPGVLPIGCFPIYLTIYQSSNSSDYDDLGCLKSFNDLSTYHNTLLQKRVDIIQSRHRKTARIMYADFYSAVYDMVRNPQTYGFSSVFETCCGSGGGKYNYQNSARCGMSGASACANPATHLSWDGIHLTEAAYKQITDGWLKGPYCRPPILHN